MKFDAAWLSELLEAPPDPERLAERLTDCGFLVELRTPAGGGEIWEVEVTTNRPDAMNHRGLAREAAVAVGTRLAPLRFHLEEGDEPASSLAAVEIVEGTPCPRYVARVIRGVSITPSPEWLQRRLEACGVRPINAVVDATNYVLLELGQPLHAFDLERLAGRRIVVRPAAPGERLRTLDGELRELDGEMMVIADAERAVALAGIMGGADTEIHAQTRDVLLESAYFEPLSVRRTARRLGMHTEASHRFERGCDPEMAAVACDRAAALIAELTGARVAGGRIDVNPRPRRPRTMVFTVAALSAFAGLEMEPSQILDIFRGLEFEPRLAGDELRVTVPSFRVDVDRAADLYEEAIRHVGYGAVPSALPVLETLPGRRDRDWELVDRSREAAVAAGLTEIITWSFIDQDSDLLAADSVICPGPALALANPLATTQSVMRRSLLPGVLSAAGANFNQGERSVALFEQGRVFSIQDGATRERERLAVVLAGDDRAIDEAFFRLKGVVQHLARHSGLPTCRWQRGGGPWLDPAAGAELVADSGEVLGLAGRLADHLAARWDLRGTVMLAELDLEGSAPPPVVRFEPLARFPAVVVDMTVEHGAELAFTELEEATRSLASDWVEGLSFVSRFVPPGGDHRVRTTLRLVYRHPGRSLTQDEVNERQERLRGALADRLGIGFA